MLYTLLDNWHVGEICYFKHLTLTNNTQNGVELPCILHIYTYSSYELELNTLLPQLASRTPTNTINSASLTTSFLLSSTLNFADQAILHLAFMLEKM